MLQYFNYHLDPPIVHTLSRQDIVVNESSTVTCNATPGNPSSTTFYWTKEDDPFFGQDGATLKLNNVQKTSFGTYICSAENIYSNEAKGRDSQSMIINVLCKFIEIFIGVYLFSEF